MLIPLLRDIHARLTPLDLAVSPGNTVLAQWHIGDRQGVTIDSVKGRSAHAALEMERLRALTPDFEAAYDWLRDKLPPLGHKSGSYCVNVLQGPKGHIKFTLATSFFSLKGMNGNTVDYIDSMLEGWTTRMAMLPWDDTLTLFNVENSLIPASNPACAVGTWLIHKAPERFDSIFQQKTDLCYATPISCTLHMPEDALSTLITHARTL